MLAIKNYLPRIATHPIYKRTKTSSFSTTSGMLSEFYDVQDTERIIIQILFSTSTDRLPFRIAFFDGDKNFLGYSYTIISEATSLRDPKTNKQLGTQYIQSNEIGACYIKILKLQNPIQGEAIINVTTV